MYRTETMYPVYFPIICKGPNIPPRRLSCICRICHKDFRNISELNSHIGTHANEKNPEGCQLCEGNYFLYGASKTETLIYLERPFKCELCPKAYKDKNGLKIHMRIHTGEKPYQCKFCDRAFKQSSSLEAHAKTHTRVKSYKCEICLKAFPRKLELKMHVRTHPSTKPYRCEFCNRSFSNTRALSVHARIHANDKLLYIHRNTEGYPEDTSHGAFTASMEDDYIVDEAEFSTTEKMIDMYIMQSKDESEDESQQPQFLIVGHFGCGICDEIFEIEKEFMEHCCHHFSDPGNDTFVDLFEGHLSCCYCG